VREERLGDDEPKDGEEFEDDDGTCTGGIAPFEPGFPWYPPGMP